jgi:hypothetical protein
MDNNNPPARGGVARAIMSLIAAQVDAIVDEAAYELARSTDGDEMRCRTEIYRRLAEICSVAEDEAEWITAANTTC